MKKLRVWILPIFSGGALLFAAAHVARTHEEPLTIEPPVTPARSPFSRTIAGAGIVEARSENVRVGTLVAGVVSDVPVKVGQRVSKGDVLFRIDARDRQAEVEVRRAQLELVEAQLQRLRQLPRPEDVPVSEALVEKAKAEVAGRKDLLDRTAALAAHNAASEEELTQRKQQYAGAVAELARVEAEDVRLKAGAWKEDLRIAEVQAAQARQQLLQAQIELERVVVRAPIDGTILKIDVRPGEFFAAPANQTLVMLGDIEQLHVRVDIDEHDLPRFQPGCSGVGYVRGDAKDPLTLEFVRVEPLAEPKKSLTGAGNERVDTRVLQAIYRIADRRNHVYVGQQLDVFLDVDAAARSTKPVQPGNAAEPNVDPANPAAPQAEDSSNGGSPSDAA